MSSERSLTEIKILESTIELMQASRGRGVGIDEIARAAGISRQAVYLHFRSRADLLIAAVRYIDEQNQLDQRLLGFRQASGGIKTLLAYVDFWGNYIPVIYGPAKALLQARETDQAAAAAWDDRMAALREGCLCVVDCLQRENLLAKGWEREKAIDMMFSVLSVGVWENLTLDRGWSQEQYIELMKQMLLSAFVIPHHL